MMKKSGPALGIWFIALSATCLPVRARCETTMLEISRNAYAGDPVSQYMIGVDQQARGQYYDAMVWFTRAADHGHARSQYCLAELYAHGLGVKTDYTKAAEWYRRAAAQGEDGALCALATMYQYGTGVTKDFVEAARLFRKAAELGNAMAMNNLGVLYAKGQGVPKNLDEARRWMEEAAAKGSVDARANLNKLDRLDIGNR